MPIEAFLPALLAVPALFLGILIGRFVSDRRHRAERRRLEADMTRRIQERYQAYVELEQHVRRLFTRLDELEAETARSLEATGVHIRQLDDAMAACEGGRAKAKREQARPEPVAALPVAPAVVMPKQETMEEAAESDDPLSWMQDLEVPQEEQDRDEPQVVVVDDEPRLARRGEREAGASSVDIAAWERKLEALREEKRSEIERQGRLVVELTERLQRMQPPGDRMRVLEKELDLWQEKYMDLERERTGDDAELLALREETPRLRTRIGELERSLSGREQEMADLDGRLEEARERVQWLETSERDQREQITGLEEQVAGLETARQGLEREIERWRKECEAAGRKADSWEQRCYATEERKDGEIAALELRVRDLEPLLGKVRELEAELGAYVEREANHKRRIESLGEESSRLKDQIAELRSERQLAADMLTASRRSLQQADQHLRDLEERHAEELAGHNQSVQELEQRLEDLTRDNERMGRELADTRASVQGQTTRIGTLMAQLDEVRQEGASLREEAEIKGSMVEAAEGLLAELRPKLEALEAKLHKRAKP